MKVKRYLLFLLAVLGVEVLNSLTHTTHATAVISLDTYSGYCPAPPANVVDLGCCSKSYVVEIDSGLILMESSVGAG
jgi:hypothetical protein